MTVPPSPQHLSNDGAMIGLLTSGSLLVGLTALTIPFLRRYTGAPYVASAPHARQAIRSFLQSQRQKTRPYKDPRLTDLGAGSGEVVLDAAKEGYIARGVELNLWLVLQSRLRARRLPSAVRQRVWFERRDLWTCGLSEEDVVVVFGVPGIMKQVGELILSECKDKCVICSNTFPVPGWEPLTKMGGVWFYSVGEQRAHGRSEGWRSGLHENAQQEVRQSSKC